MKHTSAEGISILGVCHRRNELGYRHFVAAFCIPYIRAPLTRVRVSPVLMIAWNAGPGDPMKNSDRHRPTKCYIEKQQVWTSR